MADPLTILLLVAAGESADWTTRGIVTATNEALGGDSRVLVNASHGPPDDAQALAGEARVQADAVIEVRWVAPRHARATLRVHLARTDAWIDRQIVFRPSDADSERERTLGFAIASLFPDTPGAARIVPTAPQAPQNGAADESPPPAAGQAGQAQGETHDVSPSRPAPTEPTTTTAPSPVSKALPSPLPAPAAPASQSPSPASAPPLPPSPVVPALAAVGSASASPADSPPARPPKDLPGLRRVAIEVLVIDAAGDAGAAQEVGGAGAFDWFVFQNVALRLGAGVRAATLEQAQADLVKLFGAAGVAVHLWRTDPRHPFGAAFRVDYLALYEMLTHFATQERNPAMMDGWLSGADAVVDASFQFTLNMDALAGAGVEVFAPTFVNVSDQKVTSLPPFRALFEAGLRLRF